MPVCSAKPWVSRSSAGTRPKSSSTLGRSSTASRRTSCSVATTSSRSSATASGDCAVEPLEAEQDRGQRLAGLVVQLAREPLPLELLGGDDPAQRVALHPLRELDRDRRARGEGLGEPHVVVGEAGIRRRDLS